MLKKRMLCRLPALGLLAVFFMFSVISSAASASALETASAPETAQEISSPDEAETVVEKRTCPYVKAFDGNVEESSVNLYFVNGGDIPYAEVSEYMSFYSDLMKYRNLGEVSFRTALISDHFYGVTRPDNDAAMLLDTEEDIIYLAGFNLLTQPENVDALVTIMDIPDPVVPDISDLMDDLMTAVTEEERNAVSEEIRKRTAGEPDALFQSERSSINRAGNSPTLRLCDYLIDLVEEGGKCYVPLQTFNDLFISPFYLQFIFNGEKLYGFSYGSEPMEEIYDAGPEEMSPEFAQFNLNELCFLLDCFYGLKEEHNIDNFGSLILANPQIWEGLSSTDPKTFDKTLRIFLSQYLDDSHTAFLNLSWRGGKPDMLDMMEAMNYSGIAMDETSRVSDRFSRARAAAYPDGVPMYEEIGDTAFITFDSFRCRMDEDFSQYYIPENAPDPEVFVIRGEAAPSMGEEGESASEEGESASGEGESASEEGESAQSEEAAVPDETETAPNEDTIWLLLYANRMIRRENSPIKNVVVDLSQNGGGQSSAALFAISWLTGRAQTALKDTFTSAESITSIVADVNLDNTYDSRTDSLAGDFNIYVLTSPLSFSCGNLIPAACKMAKTVTLAGQQSGGGSCVVLACTTASGSVFQMSGSKQLSIVKNGSFYNIDQGIAPDIVLTKPESFYDRQALAEYLKNCK